ncbi:MAG: M1 family metallopeptidase [Chloroflexi bacterium]|nr:M1 family metallopeptidase [Chloroflexota bacterium]
MKLKRTILLSVITIFIAACGTQKQISGGSLPELEATSTAVPHMTSTPPPQLDLPEPAEVDWNLVSHHAPAMRPEYVGDIEAWKDNNRYYIVADMEFNDTAAVINGSQRTRFRNDTGIELNEIVFRLYLNTTSLGGRTTVYDMTVDGQAVEPVFSERDTVMAVPLSEPLSDGETVELTMKFNAVMERGFAGASGQRAHFIRDLLALPGWHPTLSVVEDGVWWTTNPVPFGDPNFAETALYEIFLTHQEDVNVAVSGVAIDVVDNGDGTVTEHIVTGPMREHIILASPIMGKITDTIDGVTINVYYQPGQERGAEFTMQVSLESMEIFNEQFGDYPYSELDVAETFTTAGGIEFPGLIVVNTNLWNAGSQALENVTAHEVAHQWWYGVVHNNQQRMPWLDETLTSYSENIYYRFAYADDPQRARDHIDFSRNAYNTFRGTDGALNIPLNSSIGDINRVNGGRILIYDKGITFYNELEELVGSEVFFEALRSYYVDMKYGVSTPYILMTHFEEASGLDLDAFFYEWVGDFQGVDPEVKADIDAQNNRQES